MKAPRGFTLVELLVVVAIIGLLSSIVLASLNTARSKARDAVRKSQVGEFKTALELYFTANGHYPCSTTPSGGICTSGSAALFNGTNNPGLELTGNGFISSIPSDPLYTGILCNSTGTGYCYCSPGAGSYFLTVNTEDDKNGSDRCYIQVGDNMNFCNAHRTFVTGDCSARF